MPPLAVKPEAPKVESWVYQKPKSASCLDPGKKEYEVKELEKALSCKDTYIQKLEYRHGTLSGVLKEIEKK